MRVMLVRRDTVRRLTWHPIDTQTQRPFSHSTPLDIRVKLPATSTTWMISGGIISCALGPKGWSLSPADLIVGIQTKKTTSVVQRVMTKKTNVNYELKVGAKCSSERVHEEYQKGYRGRQAWLSTHKGKSAKHQDPAMQSPEHPVGGRLPVRRPSELAVQPVRSPIASKVETTHRKEK